MPRKKKNKGHFQEVNPVISEEEIMRLAGIGATLEMIAIKAHVSKDTIIRRFNHLVKEGRVNYQIGLLEKQWQLAMDINTKGSATMLIWLGKVGLGQQEVQKIEHDVSATCKIGKLAVKDSTGRVLVFSADSSDVEEFQAAEDSTSCTADEPKVP